MKKAFSTSTPFLKAKECRFDFLKNTVVIFIFLAFNWFKNGLRRAKIGIYAFNKIRQVFLVISRSKWSYDLVVIHETTKNGCFFWDLCIPMRRVVRHFSTGFFSFLFFWCIIFCHIENSTWWVEKNRVCCFYLIK